MKNLSSKCKSHYYRLTQSTIILNPLLNEMQKIEETLPFSIDWTKQLEVLLLLASICWNASKTDEFPQKEDKQIKISISKNYLKIDE